MASLPDLIVEAALGFAADDTDLYLDDPARGLLDTATLADGIPWTDISAYVRSFSISTGRNRALEKFKAGTASLVLNNRTGLFDPENLSGSYVSAGETQLIPMVPIRISARFPKTTGTVYPLFYGYADSWTCEYPGTKDAVTVVAATDAMKVFAKFEPAGPSEPVGDGELSGARVNRVLDLWNWPGGERDIDTGLNTLQATTLAQKASQEIDSVCDSEYGDFFISAIGRPTFRQRFSRSSAERSITNQVTFSDVQANVDAGTAIGYTGISRSGDGDLIRNVVTRQNIGGVAQTVTDVASVAKFQLVSDVKTDLVNDSDVQALEVAQWISGLFSTFEQRVEYVDVAPAGNPTVAWPAMLALKFLDLVTVVRTPPNVAAITSHNYVQGLDWSGNAENWNVRVFLESASGQLGVFILDSATLGTLDSPGVLAA